MPAGESAEFYAFGGYSGRQAVSDGLYRKADWTPRSVSYVYPDGFFPMEESTLTDGSAVVGLRGDLSSWSADMSFRFGQGEFAFDAVGSINPSYAAEYLARNPSASESRNRVQRRAAGRLQRRAQTAADGGQRRLCARLGAGGTGRGPCAGRGVPARELSDGGRRAGILRVRAQQHAGQLSAAHHQNDGTAFASCGIQGYPGYSPQSADASERDRDEHGRLRRPGVPFARVSGVDRGRASLRELQRCGQLADR